MSAVLNLELEPTRGALQRVIQTVSRRGFEPLEVTSRCSEQGAHVCLVVSGARPIKTLARQLERLIDVREVALEVPRAMLPVSYSEILDASRRIGPLLRQTPAIHSTSTGGWLKLECLQITGSFKVRGALNAVARGVEMGDRRPVVVASAGNHGQGVAWAARHLGIRVKVVVPGSTPRTKVNRCLSLGAEVEDGGESFEQAEARARSTAEERGWRFIHPFGDSDVIAGQGTVALELLELDPEAVVVPIGGGSLIAGMGIVLKEHGVRTVGAQIAGLDSMARTLRGDAAELEPQPTIADGVRVRRPGSINVTICREVVDEMVIVDEAEVHTALVDLLNEERITAEGAGAIAAAALPRVQGRRKVAVISGGNIDDDLLVSLLNEARSRAATLGWTSLTPPLAPATRPVRLGGAP